MKVEIGERMKAAVLEGEKKIVIKDVPVPVLQDGQIEIKVSAVGLDSTLDLSINAVKPGGKVVVIGNSITPTVNFNMNKLVLNEVQLLGSVSCTRVEFEETIDLISKGIINPENYVTDILPLNELQTAFERLIDENDPALKMVVKP